VEAVVRHYFSDGISIIRKTLLGVSSHEFLAYTSGLLDPGGRWWRAPRLYLAAEDGAGRWHIFIEDLAPLRRPTSADALAAAARAIGEMNGAHLSDDTLIARFPWLCDSERHAAAFVRPKWATKRLTGKFDDDLTERVARTLHTLADHESELSQAHRGLPRTFSHGDANINNVAVAGQSARRDERVALFDWSMCRVAAVAADLGNLLGVPGPRIPPSAVDLCLRSYREGMAATAATTPSAEQIAFGYRHRLVSFSLRRQLELLPSTTRPVGRFATMRDTAALAWSGRRRSRVAANLTRLCDEAELLLAFAHGRRCH
jgi:hypothetical protein